MIFRSTLAGATVLWLVSGAVPALAATNDLTAGCLEIRTMAFLSALLALFSMIALFLRRRVMVETQKIAERNTELKRGMADYESANARLKRSERRLGVVLQAANLGLWDRDVISGETFWDDNWLAMLGYTTGEISPGFESWSRLIHPSDAERVLSELQAHLDGKKDGYQCEYRLRTKSGDWKWILSSGAVTERDSAGCALRVAGINMDIDSRKMAEEQRAESEARYRQLFQTMFSGFALHDIICDKQGKPVDFRFIEVNRQFERITGMKAAEVVGRTVREAAPYVVDKWIDICGDVALTGKPVHFEDYSAHLDKHFEVSVFSPTAGKIATIFTDVTTIRRAEEEQRALDAKIQQGQKLESLGMLAGGIAHEFNNLLMGILGNTELVLEQVKVGTQAHQCAAQIDVAGRHASELCRQLLAYSGKGQFVVESLNLNVMIRDMSRLLELSVPKTCALKRVLADGLPDMKGDSRQIRQVIMNLVANAAEAVGAEQGTITIETGARNCDREYLSSPYLSEDREPGDYCYVKVSDTGHGMESSTMQRMFDPFFSTRFTGRGLGLPAVLGIVRGHKGAIIVSSEENRGSVFQVLFPVAAGAEKPPVRKPPAVDGTPASGTVLLVDDDEIVRSVSRLMLQGGGFRVLLAGDGVEAVDTYREHMNEIVCVVMDRTMPRMNGDMAMRAIRVLNPDAPVVMSSGYDAAEMSRGAPDCGIDGFLQKPYRKEQLLNAVRAVAGQSRRKASSDTASEKV